MKITRRLFNQLLAAISPALLLPKKLLGRGRDNAVAIGAATDPSPRRGHVDICYVYNPGQDLAGVQYLTFGTVNVLKGGAVTRIETAKQSIRAESVEDARFVKLPEKPFIHENGVSRLAPRISINPFFYEETVIIGGGYWSPLKSGEERWVYDTQKRDVIIHPASEILQSFSWDRAYDHLVHIKDWDNKQVDLKGVNEMIAGKTLKERARAIRALPAAWRMTSSVRSPVLQGMKHFEATRREQLVRAISGTFTVDTWQRESAFLLGIDLRRLYMEKQLTEEAWDVAHPEAKPHFTDVKAYAKWIEAYEKEVVARLRAFVSERYPPEVY